MKPFKQYWDDLDKPAREHLAKRLGTSVDYLYQIANGYREPSHKFTKRMEKETGIHRADIRPDIFDGVRL